MGLQVVRGAGRQCFTECCSYLETQVSTDQIGLVFVESFRNIFDIHIMQENAATRQAVSRDCHNSHDGKLENIMQPLSHLLQSGILSAVSRTFSTR